MSYTRQQIVGAVNRAADAVAEFAWAGDEEDARDGANLTVNLTMYFLDHPGASVREAMEASYDSATAEYLLGLAP